MRNSFSSAPWTWSPPAVALLLAMLIYIGDFNQPLFLALNHAGHAAGDFFWVNLTVLGDGAVALALILPCIRRSPQRFRAAIIAAVITSVSIQIVKHMFSMPRPLAVLPADQFFHIGPALRMNTFPSGHAAAIFTLAGIWIISLPRRNLLRTSVFVLAILVALSRTMVGVHWPLDILAGMLIGWLSAWAGLAMSNRFKRNAPGPGAILAGCVLLMIAGALVVSDHTGYAAARPLQISLGLFCVTWGAYEMLSLLAVPELLNDVGCTEKSDSGIDPA